MFTTAEKAVLLSALAAKQVQLMDSIRQNNGLLEQSRSWPDAALDEQLNAYNSLYEKEMSDVVSVAQKVISMP